MNDLDELLAIIAQRYGLSLGQARQLDGGDECLVWSVPSHQGPLVVRRSPCWRSPERLAWTHRLMLSLQAVLPQVIAAMPTGCVYDFPTSSEGKFPDIVDLEKKRQYTPFKIETITDSKRRNLSWKQYTTPPEPISDD